MRLFHKNYVLLKVENQILNINQEIGTIWQAFHKELKAFIIKKVGNENDANDILQEAFIKVIQHKEKVSQAKNVRQYLYGIVRNTTMDYFRKRKEINVELSETLGLSDQEELYCTNSMLHHRSRL